MQDSIENRVTQNKSPLYFVDQKEEADSEVLCEGFVELLVKKERKRVLCCFLPFKKPQVSIVEARLI